MLRQTVMAGGMILAGAIPLFAQHDDRIDVVAPFEVLSFEPSTSGFIFTRMGIAETLVNAAPDGTLTPGLAIAWTVSEDRLTWLFSLRQNVSFHDGTPMTAESVANALQIAAAKPGPLSDAPIVDIAVHDGGIAIQLSESLAALPAYMAESRSMILSPASYDATGQGQQMIATGPYRLTDFTPPNALSAEAFAAYWGDAPHISHVSYQAVTRPETRALLAESGDADFVFALDPASVSRLGQNPDLVVQSVAIPRTLLLKINAGHPALAEPDARRALSLAIDRTGIAKAVLRYPEGAGQLFPPSAGDWHNDALAPLAYDPVAAAALLSDLGWMKGSDGILTRDGERFALTLTTYPDRPEQPLVAAVLEQQLAAIGVAITIDSTNSSEIPARHQDGSLDLALLARNFALIPDPVGTVLSDYAPGGDWGAMNWDNPAFTGLVQDIGRGESTDMARATAILQDDLPVIPIAWYRQTLVVPSNLNGVVIDPWERSFGLQDLEWAE